MQWLTARGAGGRLTGQVLGIRAELYSSQPTHLHGGPHLHDRAYWRT